jgi:hypothetical protein
MATTRGEPGDDEAIHEQLGVVEVAKLIWSLMEAVL